MNIYRITFLKNEIASVYQLIGHHSFDGEVFLHEKNNAPVFALVKAETEEEGLLLIKLHLVNKEIHKLGVRISS
jgi:hypothetical protein